jgi:hypothetical protein
MAYSASWSIVNAIFLGLSYGGGRSTWRDAGTGKSEPVWRQWRQIRVETRLIFWPRGVRVSLAWQPREEGRR